MKKLSLKMKLTLLYTILMTALVAGIFVLLFSLGSRQIQSSAQSSLRRQVYAAVSEVDYDDGLLEFDSDFNDMENGVYLSVYESDGMFVFGRIPAGFENTIAFQEDSLQTVHAGGTAFYVFDIRTSVEDYGSIYIRGVVSAAEAEQNIIVIRRMALIIMPLLVLLAAGLGYFMSKRALAPVDHMTDVVRQIRRDNDLSKRIRPDNENDEIGRLAKTFDEMLDSIEESFRREQQFTSDVSHELRTPVAAMMLQCEELLTDETLTPKTRKGVLFLSQKVKYLSQMISQLLMLSRADQGRQKVAMEPLNLSELTEMAVLEAEEMAAERQITVFSEIEPRIYINGDETLLIRLWMNLLENAVRYGKDGGKIKVYLSSDGERIYASVEDNGIGIAQKDLPHIWERFYQADAARSSGGSGLGLSMAAWIVHAHGGQIRAESREGEGSRFSFEFPKAEAEGCPE